MPQRRAGQAAVIKFAVAALWICAVTVGATYYSFQAAGAKLAAPRPDPSLLAGLDYVKTEVISVPVLDDGYVSGYFLTRLVYTAEAKKLATLSVPAQTLLVDEVYSYLFGNPLIDFSKAKQFDVDAFRAGLRDSINTKLGEKVIHEVLVEQVDFLSKDEIRDNALRRKSVNMKTPTLAPAAKAH